MRISFDLDETLLSRHVNWEIEPGLKGFREGEEFLRKGTVELFKWIRSLEHEIWIYTNSYRGFKALETWFNECGIPVDKVINQIIHDEKKFERDKSFKPDKNPDWFGIDMHFDDLDSLAEQEKIYKIDPLDSDWVNKVKSYINLF